jgi:hypothetical protein
VKLKHSGFQSDSSRFSSRADKNSKMATKCHMSAGKKNPEMMSEAEWDEELAEMNARMDELALEMQQNTRSRWVYEWPMKTKIKWPVKELMARRQHRLLRRWLRHDENLNRPEKRVHMCEPETKRNLSDAENEMGSIEDLKNCQEGREEISDCQVGKELRSTENLIDYHEDSQGISQCQVGNGSRSLQDLMDYQEGSGELSICQVGMITEMGSVDSIDCQEGSRKIPYCQVGRDEQMRLSEGLIKSNVSLDQQMQLIEEEDRRNILTIGGIQIFLPHSPKKAKVCVADEVATIEVGQLADTIRKEALEQIWEVAQAEEEDEHFKEWLNIFSQEAEKC